MARCNDHCAREILNGRGYPPGLAVPLGAGAASAAPEASTADPAKNVRRFIGSSWWGAKGGAADYGDANVPLSNGVAPFVGRGSGRRSEGPHRDQSRL